MAQVEFLILHKCLKLSRNSTYYFHQLTHTLSY